MIIAFWQDIAMAQKWYQSHWQKNEVPTNSTVQCLISRKPVICSIYRHWLSSDKLIPVQQKAHWRLLSLTNYHQGYIHVPGWVSSPCVPPCGWTLIGIDSCTCEPPTWSSSSPSLSCLNKTEMICCVLKRFFAGREFKCNRLSSLKCPIPPTTNPSVGRWRLQLWILAWIRPELNS